MADKRWEKVAIIGSGMGGLAAAIDLARQGFEVHVFDRQAAPGGKIRQLPVGASLIDAGPTVLTMRFVFEQLLADAGTSLEAEVGVKKAEILARHAWPDGTDLDLFADVERSADAIGRFAGSGEAQGYRRFCAASRSVFEMLRDTYITADKPDAFALTKRIGLSRVSAMFRLRPFETLWQALGSFFGDIRLRQLFGRYATYCGSSPFEASATLMLVAHVEQDGVFLVEGGMQALAVSMAGLGERLGVRFHMASPVREISLTNGQVSGLVLTNGERFACDAVISNADVNALATGQLGMRAATALPMTSRLVRSLSAMTFAIEAETSGFALTRHNVFFSQDYKREFDALFGTGTMPGDPTIYVCAQDRDDLGRRIDHDATSAAGSARERLFVILNAPSNGDTHTYSEAEISRCQDQMQSILTGHGLMVKNAQSEATTPTDFNRLFPATGGALYGQASHGWMSAFQRPAARTRIKGLYLASGSAHPGPGVPMATLSGRLAARSLVQDCASTPKFRPAGIFGGMSTG